MLDMVTTVPRGLDQIQSASPWNRNAQIGWCQNCASQTGRRFATRRVHDARVGDQASNLAVIFAWILGCAVRPMTDRSLDQVDHIDRTYGLGAQGLGCVMFLPKERLANTLCAALPRCFCGLQTRSRNLPL